MVTGAAPPVTITIGFYNIRSGQGIQPLRGHPVLFADNGNCRDASTPMNAWGVGVVQRELVARVKNDPAVVALGLAEAWACASPENVRRVLGWKDRTEERNGTAIVSKFGFGGRETWLQLDTSRNRNPKDTMWVVHVPLCLDPGCRAKLDVYAAHWSGTGPEARAIYDQQAIDTIAFMARSHGPHVLVGDLNVWEGPGETCRQMPNDTTLGYLRRAGYIDAWPAVRGTAEGFTGMIDRAGCGVPEGYAWKRIDYAWSRSLAAVAIDRFGVVAPGDAAPSDHFGILASYRFQ